jgi:hypothetical protein
MKYQEVSMQRMIGMSSPNIIANQRALARVQASHSEVYVGG